MRLERSLAGATTGAPPELVADYVKANIGPVPDSLGLHPFYKKYTDAMGRPESLKNKMYSSPSSKSGH